MNILEHQNYFLYIADSCVILLLKMQDRLDASRHEEKKVINVISDHVYSLYTAM